MPDPVAEIKKYAAAAQAIEPDATRRKALLDAVNGYTESFLERIVDRPAFINTEHQGRGIYDSPIAETGMDMDSILALFREQVEEPGLSPVSGRFFGYIPPCSMYYSALGDYIAAITNEYTGEFSNCPGAVRMEHQLIDWMAGLVGYPDTARGTLASGGSIAILTCIVTAREAFGLKAADYARAVVYLTDLTHHAQAKGLHIAGMGECKKHVIPMDDRYRMRADKLQQAIQQDRDNGLLPWFVVGSTGTTDLGSIDPLADIGRVAKDNDLWYHVDGAYGGFFTLSDLVAERFNGVEMSDSIVMNPHKGLHTPFGLGAAIVKDGELLYRSHFYSANYMQDTCYNKEEISPADLGPELTRHFRALRLWLPLKLIGVAPFRAMISEKILLARYAWERINELDGFVTSPEPELSIFAFRFVDTDDPEAFNKKLLEAIRSDGTIFLSSTVIGGNYMIRFAVLSYRSHLDTIEEAVEVIAKTAQALVHNTQ